MEVFGARSVPIQPGAKWQNVRNERLAAIPGLLTLHDVDAYVNQHVVYVRDPAGQDSWALPSNTLSTGVGDCEDIALVKRTLLLALGWQDDDILFLVVRDLISHQQHALLRVDGLILDSFNDRTLPEKAVTDYAPIVGYAGDQGWAFGRRAR